MATSYVGEIRMAGFNFAPVDWAFCNGQLLRISDYEALYSLIGTTYGGDGQTTFALPNLQGRVPFHQGNGYVIGQISGTETVSLMGNQSAAHSHMLQGSTAAATTNVPTAMTLAASTVNVYTTPANPVGTATITTTDPANGGLPHDNMQPYLCLNFIISLNGVYPPHS